MNKYSTTSRGRLDSCAFGLRVLFEYVLRTYDHSIICGHRGEAAQMKAYNGGYSKVKWPKGNHNSKPSYAVDVAPYPFNFADPSIHEICFFAGYVVACAKHLDIDIRWGGDWDGDFDQDDNSFDDLYHFELKRTEI